MLFGSILGWQAVPGQATQAASKACVQNFAEGLHRELGPRGVDVLSVAPGPVHIGLAARAGLTLVGCRTRDGGQGDVVGTRAVGDSGAGCAGEVLDGFPGTASPPGQVVNSGSRDGIDAALRKLLRNFARDRHTIS